MGFVWGGAGIEEGMEGVQDGSGMEMEMGVRWGWEWGEDGDVVGDRDGDEMGEERRWNGNGMGVEWR